MIGHSSLTGMKLSTLDYIVSVMDCPPSQLDFTIILSFNHRLDIDALRRGATSARNLFPTSGSRLKNNRWIHDSTHEGVLEFATRPDDVRTFVNRRIDLTEEPPICQLLADHGRTLVTKFHHAAADGTSASLWLNHQLAVAAGLDQAQTQRAHFSQLALKNSQTSVRRSQFAYQTASEQLWTLPVERSGIRDWQSVTFEADGLRKKCREQRVFTYNDLLATAALEVFSRWNREQSCQDTPRIGLWLPVNIRTRSNEGFGNGTSRIRIYASYPHTMSFIDKCREVRRQISWCINHGEWVVPDVNALTRIPRWMTGPVLRRHLTRASLDMATGVFSHVDGWNRRGELFNALTGVECVGLLHPFQALAINGVTHNGNTWLTFTYDAGLFETEHVERIVEMYIEQIEEAGQALR